MVKPKAKPKFGVRCEEPQYIVRLWDMMDGWMDVYGPVSKAKADAYWNKETLNGTRMTKFADGDYWKVFPANTKMLVTPDYLGR